METSTLTATPFLLFDGNCKEAMTFYHQCLGGDLRLTKLGDTPMKDMFPVEKHERIINAYLKSGGVEFSATDWMAAPERLPQQGNTFAIFVIGTGFDELKATFEKLSAGASKEAYQELNELPFGMYGQFTDKFGVPWIFKGDKSS